MKKPPVIRRLIFATCATASFAGAFATAAQEPEAPRASLGTNLTGPADWNTELPFVDVFRMARKWISQREGEDWGRGPELDLDENGWVKSLEPGCYAETLVLTTSGHAPAGTYTVLYDGEGEIRFNPAPNLNFQLLSEAPGKILFELTPEPVAEDAPLFVQIRATSPGNHLRNLRILLPGHPDTHIKEPFRPGFMETWKGMACFRFMDWQKTNNSKLRTWSERPRPDSYTWTLEGGIPVEIMVDFSNRMKADPWFCMPHLADDDFVRNFARLVKDTLDPSLKVYVEYSNEVWNSMFEQTRYANEKGVELGLGPADRPWEAGWAFYGKRSVEIFKIWEEVFGGTERLVRVIASQAENTHIGRKMLEAADAANTADALAIAPYVHLNLPARSDRPDALTADEVAGWTVGKVMEEMLVRRLPKSIEQMQKYKQLADEFGLQLIAYEAGQHAVGMAGGENNDQLTALLHEANRSTEMGELYAQYLRAWQQAGGGLLANFSSIGRWTKWGSWGLMEYFDSKPQDYPKFVETLRWAKSLGQDVNAP